MDETSGQLNETPTVLSAAQLHHPALLSWLRLARIFQRIDRVSETLLQQWNLSAGMFDVLAHVARMEGVNQRELGQVMVVTKGNIAHHVVRLEERKLVVRRPQGRSNRLFVTDAGRALVAQAMPVVQNLVIDMFSGLSSEEQWQLHGLLRKLDRTIQERDHE